MNIFKWNSESLSVWSMVILFIVSTLQFVSTLTPSATLIWLHSVIHTPYSVKYHLNYLFTSPQQRMADHCNDMKFMFISHILLFIALSWKLPWTINFINVATFIVCVCAALEKLDRQETENGIKEIAVKFSWIFLLHYIPITLQHGWKLSLKHFVAYALTAGIYIQSKLIQQQNLNNLFMHVGLIINIMFAYHIVK